MEETGGMADRAEKLVADALMLAKGDFCSRHMALRSNVQINVQVSIPQFSIQRNCRSDSSDLPSNCEICDAKEKKRNTWLAA